MNRVFLLQTSKSNQNLYFQINTTVRTLLIFQKLTWIYLLHITDVPPFAKHFYHCFTKSKVQNSKEKMIPIPHCTNDGNLFLSFFFFFVNRNCLVILQHFQKEIHFMSPKIHQASIISVFGNTDFNRQRNNREGKIN